MNNELREAAERIQRTILPPKAFACMSLEDDALMLAKAYLAEHQPDDDELLDEKWVFANFPSKGEQYSARCKPDLPQLVWLNRFERFTLYDVPQPHIKTRGQVRLLLRALQ